MNSLSPIKKSWRYRVISQYREITGYSSIPKDCILFTLGGQARYIGSEYDELIHQHHFCTAEQYVSVENKRDIHKDNCTLPGVWLYGDYAECFARYYSENLDETASLILADLMCGVDKAIPTIRTILYTLIQSHLATQSVNEKTGRIEWDSGGEPDPVVIVFNIVQKDLLKQVKYGIVFRDVLSTIMTDPAILYYVKKHGLKLRDKFSYQPKTVGQGTNVEMMTLIFSFNPNQKHIDKETIMAKNTKADKKQAKKWSEAALKAWATRRANAKKTSTKKSGKK
jgi:hypothetical protein